MTRHTMDGVGAAKVSLLLGPIRRIECTRRSAIKPARNLQLFTTLTVASLGLLASQGCASTSGGPFHIYDSPLLSGEHESKYPRSRSYVPFESGSSRQAPNHSADIVGNGARAESTEIASIGSEDSPETPSLSTQKHAPAPQKGAPATTQDSARSTTESAPKNTASTPRSTSSTHAADYVWSVYALNGVNFSQASRNSVAALFRSCKERGKIYHSSEPAIGDIVFFHNTEDSNGDGRNNDWYTHAAIVESHGDNGVVTLLSYRGEQVSRMTMDLESPDAAMDRHGGEINSRLRQATDDDAPFTQYLAGQLFAGTCSALGDQAQFVIVDNWEPGMKLQK